MKASLNIRKATGDGSTSPPFSFWVWRGIGRAYTFFPKRVLTVCNDPTTLRNTQESLLQRYRPGSWYFTGLRGGVMDRDSNTHVNITHVWQDNESVKTKTLLTLNGSIHSKDLSRLTLIVMSRLRYEWSLDTITLTLRMDAMTPSDHDAWDPTRNRTSWYRRYMVYLRRSYKSTSL